MKGVAPTYGHLRAPFSPRYPRAPATPSDQMGGSVSSSNLLGGVFPPLRTQTLPPVTLSAGGGEGPAKHGKKGGALLSQRLNSQPEVIKKGARGGGERYGGVILVTTIDFPNHLLPAPPLPRAAAAGLITFYGCRRWRLACWLGGGIRAHSFWRKVNKTFAFSYILATKFS